MKHFIVREVSEMLKPREAVEILASVDEALEIEAIGWHAVSAAYILVSTLKASLPRLAVNPRYVKVGTEEITFRVRRSYFPW